MVYCAKMIKRVLSHLLLAAPLLCSVFGMTAQTETGPRSIQVQERGITAKSVHVSNGDRILQKPYYQYGQQLYIVFEELEGLVRENDQMHPNLDITLVSKQGDTLFSAQNLYGPDNSVAGIPDASFEFSIQLSNKVTSNGAYTMYGTVRDTKSSNEMEFLLDFNVVQNPDITAIPEGLDYADVFLESNDRNRIVTNNVIYKNEMVSLSLKEVSGYLVKDGKVNLRMDYTVTEASGAVVLERSGYTIKSGDPFEMKTVPVACSFNLGEADNPNFDSQASLRLTAEITDMNSDAKVTVSAKLYVIE